jgi:osmotically-inducible protein OsmY
MNVRPAKTVILGLGTLSIALCGCSQQTIESAREDAARNVKVVQREAKSAERKARPQLKKAQLGLRVTAALAANEKLPKTIHVDADENGVKLRGTVDTRAQKDLAGRIARDTLKEDKTVLNEIKVKGE